MFYVSYLMFELYTIGLVKSWRATSVSAHINCQSATYQVVARSKVEALLLATTTKNIDKEFFNILHGAFS